MERNNHYPAFNYEAPNSNRSFYVQRQFPNQQNIQPLSLQQPAYYNPLNMLPSSPEEPIICNEMEGICLKPEMQCCLCFCYQIWQVDKYMMTYFSLDNKRKVLVYQSYPVENCCLYNQSNISIKEEISYSDIKSFNIRKDGDKNGIKVEQLTICGKNNKIIRCKELIERDQTKKALKKLLELCSKCGIIVDPYEEPVKGRMINGVVEYIWHVYLIWSNIQLQSNQNYVFV